MTKTLILIAGIIVFAVELIACSSNSEKLQNHQSDDPVTPIITSSTENAVEDDFDTKELNDMDTRPTIKFGDSLYYLYVRYPIEADYQRFFKNIEYIGTISKIDYKIDYKSDDFSTNETEYLGLEIYSLSIDGIVQFYALDGEKIYRLLNT